MELSGESKLLRIFVGEKDVLGHKPLYEVILYEAKKNNMAGCTVLRGIMSYGASSVVHTAGLIEISSDMPIVIEIIDLEEKINAFSKVVGDLLEKLGCGGLVTVEKAAVLWYMPKK